MIYDWNDKNFFLQSGRRHHALQRHGSLFRSSWNAAGTESNIEEEDTSPSPPPRSHPQPERVRATSAGAASARQSGTDGSSDGPSVSDYRMSFGRNRNCESGEVSFVCMHRRTLWEIFLGTLCWQGYFSLWGEIFAYVLFQL